MNDDNEEMMVQKKHGLKKAMFLKKLSLFAGSLIVCMVMAEGMVRLVLKDSIVLFPRFHSKAEYGPYTIRRLRPNSRFIHQSTDGLWEFITNSKGFRDEEEHAYAKPEGVLRVLCLGDSHTQGFECAQDATYSSIMEACLKQRGLNAEVINAGVSGFSTAESLVLLEYEGIRYKPDAVVLGFFSNDLDDNVKADLFRLEGDLLQTNKYEHIPGVEITMAINFMWPLRWLSQRSYAYSYLFNTVWKWRKSALLSQKEQEMTTEYAIASEDEDHNLRYEKQKLCSALISRMYKFCKTNDIKLIIADIPCMDSKLETVRSSIPAELNDISKSHSDAFIEYSVVVPSQPTPSQCFVPNGQRHISERTHERIGKACAEALVTLL
jgi:hypothetical protein